MSDVDDAVIGQQEAAVYSLRTRFLYDLQAVLTTFFRREFDDHADLSPVLNTWNQDKSVDVHIDASSSTGSPISIDLTISPPPGWVDPPRPE